MLTENQAIQILADKAPWLKYTDVVEFFGKKCIQDVVDNDPLYFAKLLRFQDGIEYIHRQDVLYLAKELHKVSTVYSTFLTAQKQRISAFRPDILIEPIADWDYFCQPYAQAVTVTLQDGQLLHLSVVFYDYEEAGIQVEIKPD